MKYIDADKLIAEIERKIEEITIECQKSRTIQFSLYGKINGFEQTLNLVRSLQQEMELPEKYQTPDWLFEKQEQPEVDLENYLENYFKGWHVEEEIGLTKPDGWSCIVDDLKGIARHFWNKGYNARKEE